LKTNDLIKCVPRGVYTMPTKIGNSKDANEAHTVVLMNQMMKLYSQHDDDDEQ